MLGGGFYYATIVDFFGLELNGDFADSTMSVSRPGFCLSIQYESLVFES
jgi:hypothetical protein